MKCIVKICSLVLLIFTSLFSSAQSVAMDADINPGGLIMEMPLETPRIKGSTYIRDYWVSGKLELVNGQIISELPLKYDVQNNVLEIKHEGEIRLCSFDRLKSFELDLVAESRKQKFVNSIYYSISSQTNPKTLLELMNNGEKTNMFKRYSVEIREPTYVPEFDTGSRETTISLKEKYYVLYQNKFYELSTSLKKNKDLFSSKYDDIERYIKKYRLKLKKERDLIEVIKHYDSLL